MIETKRIGVLNYNENIVSVEVAPKKSYRFDPSADGITPTVIPMSIDEIRYANNSGVFKNGLLFFEKDKEEEIYNMLNIVNWQDILTNNDIKEILVHPTFDGLSKIVDIKDSSIIDRVRVVLHKLNQDNRCDVSVRVAQIVQTRYKELLNRQINTNIVLTKNDVPNHAASEEMDSLRKQNEILQEQMAKMQEMMEQMMAEKKMVSNDEKEDASTDKKDVESETSKSTTTKKTSSRSQK